MIDLKFNSNSEVFETSCTQNIPQIILNYNLLRVLERIFRAGSQVYVSVKSRSLVLRPHTNACIRSRYDVIPPF